MIKTAKFGGEVTNKLYSNFERKKLNKWLFDKTTF